MGKNMTRKHKKNFLLEVPFVFFLVILITLSPNIAVWLGFENGPFVKEASAQQVELLTTSGTWTAPANVYEVTVEAWGAGGGAGGPNNKVYSPGGGGGAYSSATLSVTPSSNYSYTIGTGCTTTGVSLGTSATFVATTTTNIDLMTSTAGDIGCRWDLTGVSLSQRIPAGQQAGSYSIGMTLTAN